LKTLSEITSGLKVWVTNEDMMNGCCRLLFCFARLDARKINAAFTIASAAFFCRQAFIYHTADVKNSGGKKNNN
jgi:hypothetical protein